MTGRPPLKTLRLWQARIFVFFLILIFSAAYFFAGTVFYAVFCAVLAAVTVFVQFWYLPKYFKSFSLTVGKSAVVINCGVIIKTSHIMPFPAVVFAQSFSTPLARRLSLSALTLKAARAFIIVPEMEERYVIKLLDAFSGGKP